MPPDSLYEFDDASFATVPESGMTLSPAPRLRLL
jgi:hypothetical protein